MSTRSRLRKYEVTAPVLRKFEDMHPSAWRDKSRRWYAVGAVVEIDPRDAWWRDALADKSLVPYRAPRAEAPKKNDKPAKSGKQGGDGSTD